MSASCDSIRATRFPELGYVHQFGDWRFVDLSTGAAIGPYYKTKTGLMADLERFAMDFGCNGAACEMMDAQDGEWIGYGPCLDEPAAIQAKLAGHGLASAWLMDSTGFVRLCIAKAEGGAA